MSAAVFDLSDHAIVAGWATYHMDNHEHIEAGPPVPPNGHHPSNYARCACGAWVKWFVIGQHRYGSLAATEGSEG